MTATPDTPLLLFVGDNPTQGDPTQQLGHSDATIVRVKQPKLFIPCITTTAGGPDA